MTNTSRIEDEQKFLKFIHSIRVEGFEQLEQIFHKRREKLDNKVEGMVFLFQPSDPIFNEGQVGIYTGFAIRDIQRLFNERIPPYIEAKDIQDIFETIASQENFTHPKNKTDISEIELMFDGKFKETLGLGRGRG